MHYFCYSVINHYRLHQSSCQESSDTTGPSAPRRNEPCLYIIRVNKKPARDDSSAIKVKYHLYYEKRGLNIPHWNRTELKKLHPAKRVLRAYRFQSLSPLLSMVELIRSACAKESLRACVNLVTESHEASSHKARKASGTTRRRSHGRATSRKRLVSCRAGKFTT